MLATLHVLGICHTPHRAMTDGGGEDDRTTRVFEPESTSPPDDTPSLNLASSRARLVVLQGSQQGRKYPLDEQSTIGRATACTVQLEDSMVSRKHAILERNPDGTWLLVDLGSRNGTMLNGRRAGRDPIRFGDRIQIGETILLFSHVDPIEERILHRQKLEAIGRLGAGISHDINNVLGGILMNTDFILSLGEGKLSDPEVQESLADLRASAVLGAELTRRILSLARRGSGEHSQVDLSALVDEAMDLARRTFDRSIRVDREIAPQIHVRGDRGHLHQMLMNLLLNAKDAMLAGGVLSVRLAHADTAEVDSEMVAVAGHHVMLEVIDSGVGMNAATRQRIFEPFFTTKSAEKGSGLGLSTVLEVVTGHGGTITCESEIGKGATFRVVLPALVATARPESRTPLGLVRQPVVRGAARILVVDDEPVSRRSLCRLLSREGHTMIPAADGREALAMLTAEPSSVDLVLMDLDMPELDGQETQLAMRRVRHDVRVVFLTGFVEESRKRELLDEGACAVLAKPCEADVLRAAITSALASPLMMRGPGRSS
jgi:two-component system cell cycle sensor histidine kinase/response regulator CckA